MSKYPEPVRCIRAHNAAMYAKWGAHLLLRIEGISPDKEFHGETYSLTLREISERMVGVCYANTPEATIETAGHFFEQEGIFSLYTLAYSAYYTARQYDKHFPWRDAIGIINANLQHLTFAAISPEALAAFGFSWEEREQLRLAIGIYKDVPWDLPPIPGHYAHVSGKSPGVVAFTQNAAKGERDIQTPMKAGRYLKRFYDLSAEKIEALQAMIFEQDQVRIAATADDIERVYVTGPQSCMSGPADKWEDRVDEHPVRAYAGGDLAVAYLANRKGKVAARAVVWPEKKVYRRSYGDPKLAQALYNMGYHQGEDWCFEGARIRRVSSGRNAERGTILCPHVDGNLRFKLGNDDNFMVIDPNGPYHHPAGGSGYMTIPYHVACGCGCGTKDYSNNMLRVNYGGGANPKGQSWTPACVNKGCSDGRLEQCRMNNGWYSPENMVDVHAYTNNRSRTLRMSNYEASRRAQFCGDGKWYGHDFQFEQDRWGGIWEHVDYLQRLKTHKLIAPATWAKKESTAA